MIIESTGRKLGMDDTKIYNIKKYNKELIRKVKTNSITKEEQDFLKLLKENKYDEIRKKIIFNPLEFLRTIYLYVLIEA